MGHDPLIKSQLASHNSLEGFMRCKFGHEVVTRWSRGGHEVVTRWSRVGHVLFAGGDAVVEWSHERHGTPRPPPPPPWDHHRALYIVLL